MKQLSLRQAPLVDSLPTPSGDLAGSTVRLSSDNNPYWCNGLGWSPMGGGMQGALTSGTVTLDFGAFPGSNESSSVVSGQAGVLASSTILLSIMEDTTVDHDAEDHRYSKLWLSLTSSIPTNGVGFTVFALCEFPLEGTYKVRWSY